MNQSKDKPRVNWILKALVQNVISLLPEKAGNRIYYKIQKKYGQLNKISINSYINHILKMEIALQKTENTLRNKRVLEIGTGKNIVMPLLIFALGAKSVTTIDINPYLTDSLIQKSIKKIKDSLKHIVQELRSVRDKKLVRQRLHRVCDAENPLLEASVEYRAPCDASDMNYPNSTFDVHMSNQVIEHIKPETIRLILREGRRLLSEEGIMVHDIGMHDHFTTLDDSISTVNFLKYDEWMWSVIAGNRFMYHNRLRASQMKDLFQQEGLNIILSESQVDPNAVEELNNSFPLSNRFRQMENEDLATTHLRIVANFNH